MGMIPKESAGVFIVEGYGAPLIRRLLTERLGWWERQAKDLSPLGAPPQLYWNGSTAGRKMFKDEVIQPWQLVNHFPRSGSIGSKSALLWNLRDLCSNSVSGEGQATPLMEFYPRAYDLRNPKELKAFLLDFAVTKAESVLRDPKNFKPGNLDEAEGLIKACRLLDRICALQAKDMESLLSGSNAARGAELDAKKEGVPSLGSEEWLFQSGTGTKKRSDGRRTTKEVFAADFCGTESDRDPKEGLLLGALMLESRWWMEHLQNQEHRQFALNGDHAFWILKDPGLNCGRGINCFSDLMPLLEEAQAGSWNMVVQKYMEKPLLVSHDRRKCDVRLWVALTSWNPAVIWAWPEPYLRLASRPFSWDKSQVSDPFVHLTNRTVQKFDGADKSVPKELPTQDEAHIMLLPAFFRWARDGLKDMPGGAQNRWKEYTWPRMLEAVRACVKSCRDDVGGHPPGCFELFGFDFLLDSDMRPWLLEANSSPDLCEDAGPSLRGMTETAVTELLQLTVASQKGEVPLPTGLHKPEVDERVSGSGHWHLVYREEVSLGSKELQLRRAIRSARRPQSVVGASSPNARRAGRSQHQEVLRAMLGSNLTPPLTSGIPGVGSGLAALTEQIPLRATEFVLSGPPPELLSGASSAIRPHSRGQSGSYPDSQSQRPRRAASVVSPLEVRPDSRQRQEQKAMISRGTSRVPPRNSRLIR